MDNKLLTPQKIWKIRHYACLCMYACVCVHDGNTFGKYIRLYKFVNNKY